MLFWMLESHENLKWQENSREDGAIQAPHTGAFPSKNTWKNVVSFISLWIESVDEKSPMFTKYQNADKKIIWRACHIKGMKKALLRHNYKKIQVYTSLPTDSTTPSFWYTTAQVRLKLNCMFKMLLLPWTGTQTSIVCPHCRLNSKSADWESPSLPKVWKFFKPTVIHSSSKC